MSQDHPSDQQVQAFSGGVLLVVEGELATVWLDRPQLRNAQTFATFAGLRQACDAVPAAVRVVLLRGRGPDFSAGLDLRMLRPGGVPDEGSLEDLVRGSDADLDGAVAGFQSAFTGWSQLDAVSVAVVQGRAIGAGFQLALAADLRVAAEDAAFVMAEARLGLVPDLGGTRRLARLVGPAAALEICLTTRPVPAREALRLGLVNRVVGDLDAGVQELVASILGQPPAAGRAIVRLLRDAAETSPADQLAAERRAQVPLLRALPHP